MTRVFISYCHKDEAWKDRVVSQLGVLAGEGLDTWDDRRIGAGDDWLPEIEQAIAACDVALLLVSAHFLTSKFILSQEIPALLQRREKQGIRVIPVILSPCQWTRISWLKSIQARPKDGEALSGMSDHDAESALSTLTGEIHDLHDLAPQQAGADSAKRPQLPDAIDLTHLPAGAEHFFGREAELAALDAAWADGGRTHIVELIAPGGVGKTALLKRWLERMKADSWRGARRVYGWSFYSQGTDDKRQASEDSFIGEALKWFGVEHDPALNPWDKGRKLAEAVVATRTLLVLDGVEPLQYPPGPLSGKLHAPGLEALLQHLASAGHSGLCLISSRERLSDLAEYERADDHPAGAVLRRDLGNLADTDGAQLLHKLGTNKAGAAPIASDDEELKQASREVQGHGLTLSLLGRYLALAYAGDIRQRDQVDFQEADAESLDGHAFRVIAAYETWFAREGKKGERELAAMRLLGFFDRPASRESLRALRTAPAIAGLTRPLVTLTGSQWRTTLSRLEACGLIYPSEDKTSLDAHPLVREYLANTLRERLPEAWREGHRRLYEQLKASAPQRPEGLSGLQPLYQAVVHGCLAGFHQKALAEVYQDRILRGTGDDGFYSARKLGAHGADLGALACFFIEPWQRPAPFLAEPLQAWLLGEAGFHLRALGRLDEALEPMRAAAEMAAEHGTWKNAATNYGNLSELQLSLGRIDTAVAIAEQSLDYAARSGDAFERLTTRTTLADALHQLGDEQAAAAHFVEAEIIQAKEQRDYPLLYSLWGFQYCDLLLSGAERAAWRKQGEAAPIRRCTEVAERGKKMFEWRVPGDPLLDIALDHLTLGRCALYAALLQGESPHAAQVDVDRALDGLQIGGDRSHLLGRHVLDDAFGHDHAVRPQLGAELVELPDDVIGVLPGDARKDRGALAVFAVALGARHHLARRDAFAEDAPPLLHQRRLAGLASKRRLRRVVVGEPGDGALVEQRRDAPHIGLRTRIGARLRTEGAQLLGQVEGRLAGEFRERRHPAVAVFAVARIADMNRPFDHSFRRDRIVRIVGGRLAGNAGEERQNEKCGRELRVRKIRHASSPNHEKFSPVGTGACPSYAN